MGHKFGQLKNKVLYLIFLNEARMGFLPTGRQANPCWSLSALKISLCEPPTRIELVTYGWSLSAVESIESLSIVYFNYMSREWDSNPRPTVYDTVALPIELSRRI